MHQHRRPARLHHFTSTHTAPSSTPRSSRRHHAATRAHDAHCLFSDKTPGAISATSANPRPPTRASRLPSQAAAVRHEHRRARLSSTSAASGPQRPSPQQPATPPSAPPFFGVSFPRLPHFTSPSTSATRGQAQHRRQARRHPLRRHVQGQRLCHRLLQQQRERPPGVRPRHTSRWCTPAPP